MAAGRARVMFGPSPPSDGLPDEESSSSTAGTLRLTHVAAWISSLRGRAR